MNLIELTRTFVAVQYTRISFVFLLILLICAFGFYFFSQSTHAKISHFKPKGISTETKWFSLEINNNFGIEGNGFSTDRAEKLIEGGRDFIKDWFIALDNGKYNIELLSQSHEIYPQLYLNDAPRSLNVLLHKGKLPQKDSQELLVSYDFWSKKLASYPGIIGDYIEIDGAKFLISGVTEKGFDSLFLGQKYDVFVDAKQWISSQSQNPMFLQIIMMARPINLAITSVGHLSHKQILSNIQIVAENLNFIQDSSLLLFEGLVSDIKGVQALVDFSTFYYYTSIALLVLALLAFALYQGMFIMKQQNELCTRNILGEGETYLLVNQLLYVFFWLMVAMLLGAMLFSVCLAVFKESSLLSFLQIKFNAKVLLLSLVSVTFFNLIVSIVLGCFALVVVKQNRALIKKIFSLMISISMLIMVGLTTVAWINKKTLDNKFTDKIHFQTDGVYQWVYTPTGLDTLASTSNDPIVSPQEALKAVLQNNLAAISGVEDILVSGVTPINGFNSKGFQKIEEDGSFTLKNDYFANVSATYFDFFKIPVVSGYISKEVGQLDVVINETLAKKYGGVEKAVGKKTDRGEHIVAVVKDAHFLSSEMVVPPFSYYINEKSQNVIISIKGDFNALYVNEVVEDVMQEYHGHLAFENWWAFKTEFKKYFTQDFNRLWLLSLILITIFVIGLFSVYSGTLQWITINRKDIAIKFALGLTENKLCRDLVFKTTLWLLIVGGCTGFLLYLVLPVIRIQIDMATLLSVIGSILTVLVLSITFIYWIVLNRMNKDFLGDVL